MADLSTVTLIDINDIRTFGRRMTKLRDDDDVEVLILDAQSINLKHQLGDKLFTDLLKWKLFVNLEPDFTFLMEGGVFEDTGNCNNTIFFEGIRKSLVYYTQALMVQHPNFITRFGIVQKEDAYNSANIELKQRLAYENGLRTTADLYMRNTLKYILSDKDTFGSYGYSCCNTGPKQTSNIKIKVIGE